MPKSPAHILIIDDDAGIRRLIELTLRKGGYRFSMAANGLRALEQIQTEMPDLVICDLMMPEMDGFELLATVKASAALAHIPIVVITAVGQQTYVERALKLGATACLFKPFAQAELLSVVKNALTPVP